MNSALLHLPLCVSLFAVLRKISGYKHGLGECVTYVASRISACSPAYPDIGRIASIGWSRFHNVSQWHWYMPILTRTSQDSRECCRKEAARCMQRVVFLTLNDFESNRTEMISYLAPLLKLEHFLRRQLLFPFPSLQFRPHFRGVPLGVDPRFNFNLTYVITIVQRH